METWCDWIDAVLGDVASTAAELNSTLITALPAQRTLADSLRSSSLPSAAFMTVPGLLRKAALANTLIHNVNQIQVHGEGVLAELQRLAKNLEELRGCCPS